MPKSAFDNYAPDYDVHFTESPIGKLQRGQVYSQLFPLLDKKFNILEINCGTGVDAIAMSPFVHSILAADISERMISQAKQKTGNNKIQNIEFCVSDTNTIHLLLKKEFDLLFSNFAGLNCLSREELKDFANNIRPFIKKGGKLFLIMLGTKCAWENTWHFLRRDKNLHRRQKKEGVETVIGSEKFNTYYYSPSDVSEIFEPFFKVKKTRPVGLFVPPSYLNEIFTGKEKILSLFDTLDKTVARTGLFANRADHFTVLLEKPL
jgi:ubiquinone/menaquinone biosynthesis C-methylase UbiE